MAKKKISAFTAATSYLATDGIPLIAGLATTPASRVMSMENLFTKGVTAITTTGLVTAANFKTDTATGTYDTVAIGENVFALGGTAARSLFLGSNIAYGAVIDNDGTGGNANIYGCDNILIGANCGVALASPARRNVAVGSYALEDLISGYANIALGYRSLTDVTTGVCNVAIGDGALMCATDSYFNVCVGIEAGLSVGYSAIHRNVSAFGHHAAYGGAAPNEFTYCAGDYSTWLGSYAGGAFDAVRNHEKTTAVGAFAGYLGGANCVFIGYYAGGHSTANNEFYLDGLGRSSSANEKSQSLLYGVFNADPANQTLAVNASLSSSINVKLADNIPVVFGSDSDSYIWDTGTAFVVNSGAHTTYLDGAAVSVRTSFTVTPDAGSAYMYIKGAGATAFYFSQDTGGNAYLYQTANKPIFFGTNNLRRVDVAAAGGLIAYYGFTTWDTIALGNTTEGGTALHSRKSVRDLVTLSGATSVTTFNIPAGAVLLGASFCVNTAVSDDTADPDTWSAAFSGGSTTALVSAAAAAKQTKVNKLIVPEVASNTTNITFTPQGGSFDGGVIEVVAYYEVLTSLADAA